MVNISAAQVKELRERTGAPMMECKKFLLACDGDIEKAIEEMRKSGQAKAVKKAGRVAAEGRIIIKMTANKLCGVILEVNCETDFVANSEHFIDYADKVAEIAINKKIDNIAELLNTKYENGESIEEARHNLVAKIGENVQLRRLKMLTSSEAIGSYSHGNRIGVLVALKNSDEALTKDIAMQIAASNPMVVKHEDVSKEAVEAEKEIFSAQVKESGKPQEIINKMIEGRLNKFMDEVSLYGQPFIKDPNIKVGQFLKDKNAEVINFVRFEVGEGIEKKEDNFAEEVKAQTRDK